MGRGQRNGPAAVPSDPIRVLHVLGGAGIGGVETFVKNTAESIDRERFDLSVCVIGPEGPLTDDLGGLDVPVLCLGPQRFGPASVMRFQRWLRQRRPHVLHANVGGRRVRWLARSLTRSAVICHVHGPAEGFAQRFQARDPGLRPWIGRTYGDASDLVLTCSRWLRDTISEIAPEMKPPCRALPYGIDASAAPCGLEARMRARSEHRLPADAPVIGFVGRFCRQKGIEHLGRIASQWLGDEDTGHFLAIGDGPLEPILRALRDAHGDRVRLLGPRRDVHAILPGLDLMLLTSRWEAFGIVNLEAMAAGVPVVAFDVDGVGEVLSQGTSGVLVPSGDEAAMLTAVRRLVADPEERTRMGRAGRERVLRSFTLSQMARELSDHYRRLLADG